MERRKVDEIENELAVEAREAAIGRATRMMYNNRDEVKAFHSKMLLADVMQEREMQDKLKKRKQKQEVEVEKQWIEEEMRQMDDFDEKTRKKLEE
jgi:hypothetical protein